MGPDEHIVANLYAAASEEGAALLDEASLAYCHRFAVVDIKRRQHGDSLVKGFVKDASHELMYFLRGPVACVHLCRRLHRVEDVCYQQFITRVVWRYHFATNVSVKNFVSHIYTFYISLKKQRGILPECVRHIFTTSTSMFKFTSAKNVL